MCHIYLKVRQSSEQEMSLESLYSATLRSIVMCWFSSLNIKKGVKQRVKQRKYILIAVAVLVFASFRFGGHMPFT